MYKIYCDGVMICDSRVEDLAVIDPSGRVEANRAGVFSFIMPPTHPYYGAVTNRKSIIDVYRGKSEEPFFEGVCVSITDDFYNQRNIECEGELTFLNDSIQRPARYQNMTPRTLLEAYIASHNAQVEEYKQFTVGAVTVDDSNNIYRYTNYQSTMQEIAEDLIDNYDGFIRLRHENGIRYIDYLKESPHTSSQEIRLGLNLLDFSKTLDSTDIATVLIPLGATLEESPVEGLDARLTIESVNGGKDYLVAQDAVNLFGKVSRVVTWDDVTTPEALKSKGEKYLAETQFERLVIEAKAIDLGITDEEVESFRILDLIRIVSAPHGLDKYFMLSKLEFNLNSPQNDVITLGIQEKNTMSAKTQGATAELLKLIEKISPSTILSEAVQNATALITTAMGGTVYKTQSELYIMDTADPNTAKKVWRWNINGLGYSKNGVNGPYEIAMTMDGHFVASAITVDGLEVGTNVTMGPNATISWNNVTDQDGVKTVINEEYIETLNVRAKEIFAGDWESEDGEFFKIYSTGDAYGQSLQLYSGMTIGKPEGGQGYYSVDYVTDNRYESFAGNPDKHHVETYFSSDNGDDNAYIEFANGDIPWLVVYPVKWNNSPYFDGAVLNGNIGVNGFIQSYGDVTGQNLYGYNIRVGGLGKAVLGDTDHQFWLQWHDSKLWLYVDQTQIGYFNMTR